MVQLNLALREINCKIVYFGPGLSGKTTNLEIVHQKAPDSSKGELTSIATESDRTLFFDFMPLNLGKVGGMQTKFQLYTVPGQVYYNSTRKLVLRGADGVVFVADSSPSKMEENIESLDNLEECLREQGRSLSEMPHVLQWNKRDLPDAMSPEDMNQILNRHDVPTVEAVASKGDGVIETFKALSALVLEKVKGMTEERGPRVSAPAPGAPGKPAAGPGVGTPPQPSRAPAAPASGGMQIQRNTPPMPEISAPPVAPAASPPPAPEAPAAFTPPAPAAPPPPAASVPRPAPIATPAVGMPPQMTPAAPAPPVAVAPPPQQITPIPPPVTPARPSVSPIGVDPTPAPRTGRTGSGSQRLVVMSTNKKKSGTSPLVWLLVGAAVAGAVAFAFVKGLI